MENNSASSPFPFPVNTYFESDDADMAAVIRNATHPGNDGFACSFESLKSTSAEHTRNSSNNLLEAFARLTQGG